MEGTVHAGQSFRQRIGGGLDLVLEATAAGWITRILPTRGPRPEFDFAELATPPFRSVNPLLLTTDFGFRSQDAVGWNPRRFRYLRGPSAYASAKVAYQAVMSSPQPTRTQEMAITRVAEAAVGGTLEIIDAILVPGTGDQSKAAALVATHFDTTAHTTEPVDPHAPSRQGRLLAIRFRVTFADSSTGSCRIGG